MPDIDRHALLATLRSLLGVPFRHQGRDRSGLDCLGVVLFVAQAHGIPLEDQRGYPASTDGSWLRRECARQLVEIPVAEAQPGDVVQWAERSSREGKAPPCNLAFVAWHGGQVTLIHALVAMGGVYEHGYRAPWSTTMVQWAYQLPGMAPWAA